MGGWISGDYRDKHRLLTHFYTYLFWVDPHVEHIYRRFNTIPFGGLHCFDEWLTYSVFACAAGLSEIGSIIMMTYSAPRVRCLDCTIVCDECL